MKKTELYPQKWSAVDIKASVALSKHHKLRQFIQRSELFSPFIIVLVIVGTFFLLNSTIVTCQLDGLNCIETRTEGSTILYDVQNSKDTDVLVQNFTVTTVDTTCSQVQDVYIATQEIKTLFVENCSIPTLNFVAEITYKDIATGETIITSTKNTVDGKHQFLESTKPKPPPTPRIIVYPEEDNSTFGFNKESFEKLIRPPDPVRPSIEGQDEPIRIIKGCIEQDYCDGKERMFLRLDCTRVSVQDCENGCTNGQCY